MAVTKKTKKKTPKTKADMTASEQAAARQREVEEKLSLQPATINELLRLEQQYGRNR